MARLSSLISSPVDLKIVVSLVFLMVRFYATAGQQTCSQKTQFIMHDPKNPSVPVTCKNCPICPPGHGLPKECGDKVPYGTSTDCVPCKANKTYSLKNDSSTCKSCDYRENRIVSQECTPKQNRIYGGCIQGHYFKSGIDECKECFFCCPGAPESHHLQQCKDLGMPRHLQCEDTKENKKCQQQRYNPTTSPLETMEKKWNGTIDVSEPVQDSGITAINSTSIADNPKTEKTANLANEIHGVSPPVHDESSTNSDIIVGAVVGIMIVLVGPYLIYRAVKKYRRSANSSGQGEDGLPLRQLPANDHLARVVSIDNGGTTPSSQNQSSASSCTSSAELLYNNQTEALAQENSNLDVQRIPEGRVISDMEWLRDNSDQLMLFYIRQDLDSQETVQEKTWQSIGLFLGVNAKTLKMILSNSYYAQQSSTDQLIQLFKTMGDEEPTMRRFVQALITCGRKDVARCIINWPWDLARNSNRLTQ